MEEKTIVDWEKEKLDTSSWTVESRKLTEEHWEPIKFRQVGSVGSQSGIGVGCGVGVGFDEEEEAVNSNPNEEPAEGGEEDEGVNDEAVKVVDIVDTFRLQVSLPISISLELISVLVLLICFQ